MNITATLLTALCSPLLIEELCSILSNMVDLVIKVEQSLDVVTIFVGLWLMLVFGVWSWFMGIGWLFSLSILFLLALELGSLVPLKKLTFEYAWVPV